MQLTADLRSEYERLFAECKTRPEWEGEVERFAFKVREGWAQYQKVEKATGVPWFVVGLIHGLECGFSWKQHLHNGDPLTAKTKHVPAGRPPGDPPFGWLESAIDALKYDDFTSWTDWTLAGICFKLESYNGWGYRKLRPQIPSPYLWSFSNIYEKGKYTGDGHFDPNAVSKQAGAITALAWLVAQHIISLKAIGLA
jgi:lysozyme family protein